jgi:hypothetical protein
MLGVSRTAPHVLAAHQRSSASSDELLSEATRELLSKQLSADRPSAPNCCRNCSHALACQTDASAPRFPAPRERELVARFAAAVERGDVVVGVALLTDDAWLTMPPEPYEYQGHAAIAGFLHDRACRWGAHL